MANIIGCEVISLESYYKPEQVRDYKYDEYSSLDIALLTKVMPFSLIKSTDFLGANWQIDPLLEVQPKMTLVWNFNQIWLFCSAPATLVLIFARSAPCFSALRKT